MAPPKEMLVGRKDTRPFYNFTLFATSMKFFKICTWHSGKKPKLFQTSMPPCACHGLVFPSREGQPQWIFLLFPAKRTQKRGPRHLGRATCDFICALISASKWRLALFSQLEFTRYFMIQQVSCALKMEIQALPAGRVGPGYKFETKDLFGKS